MESVFNKFIALKSEAQSLASFFQNNFEGEYPDYVIEEFVEHIDSFIENIKQLKAEGVEFIKNKK